jgi:hypothetical protein
VEREASLDYADKRGIGGVVYLGEINRITIYDRAKGTSTETTLEKISRSVGADPAGKEPVK